MNFSGRHYKISVSLAVINVKRNASVKKTTEPYVGGWRCSVSGTVKETKAFTLLPFRLFLFLVPFIIFWALIV